MDGDETLITGDSIHADDERADSAWYDDIEDSNASSGCINE